MKSKSIPVIFCMLSFLYFCFYCLGVNTYSEFSSGVFFTLENFKSHMKTLSILLFCSAFLLSAGIYLVYTKQNFLLLSVFSIFTFVSFVGCTYYELYSFLFFEKLAFLLLGFVITPPLYLLIFFFVSLKVGKKLWKSKEWSFNTFCLCSLLFFVATTLTIASRSFNISHISNTENNTICSPYSSFSNYSSAIVVLNCILLILGLLLLFLNRGLKVYTPIAITVSFLSGIILMCNLSFAYTDSTSNGFNLFQDATCKIFYSLALCCFLALFSFLYFKQLNSASATVTQDSNENLDLKIKQLHILEILSNENLINEQELQALKNKLLNNTLSIILNEELITQIRNLKNYYDSNILSEAEFTSEKAKILDIVS